MKREDLRNIAIVAHVDHGKTTLVDELLKQSGGLRENRSVVVRVMDAGELERERGITILAKNTSIFYKGVKINVIDTPGHADFSGEVERVLKMADGVLLLVDAAEGPMPQTRFVLEKALSMGHKVIVVVNKIDRPDARPHEVVDEVLDLLISLDADDDQLNSPVLFCSARDGTASFIPEGGVDLVPLMDTILSHIDPPEAEPEGPSQMLVSSIDYTDYVGRICTGKIQRGSLKRNQDVEICDFHNRHAVYKGRIANLYQIDGLKKDAVEEAFAGEIVCVSGIGEITIGDTICQAGSCEPLSFVNISQPTMEMVFSVNNGPFAGREGKYVTSRHLRERLNRELLKDVSLRVEDGATADSFRVFGRGEMHFSILIETMRREGYEFMVGAPRVLWEKIDGVMQEPIERMVCDVPSIYVGTVIEKIGLRRGELVQMQPRGERMRLEYLVPSRGLFGYRSEFLTDTRGEGVLTMVFEGYAPDKGEISRRPTGSLIAFETGEATGYGIFNAQDRGIMFITPGTQVYEGMVVGQSPKAEDIAVNVCKKKHVTNMRASGSDEALRLVPPRQFSLEGAMEFIAGDELIEITPKNFRIRKQILSNQLRMKAKNKE